MSHGSNLKVLGHIKNCNTRIYTLLSTFLLIVSNLMNYLAKMRALTPSLTKEIQDLTRSETMVHEEKIFTTLKFKKLNIIT